VVVFKKIRYKNFLSSGNIFTEIELNKNKKTLIIGKNGSGKSTFLDALTFCLFNKAFRNINKPQLINSITTKGLLVEVDFSIGKKEYTVRRGMKPNLFEILCDGKLLNQAADNRDYQQSLEKNILKMNYRTFVQIVILGSANFTPFMQLAAAQRRELIEDLLDIQVFSLMNSLLKDNINSNRDSLMEVEHQLDIVRSKIELNKKHINDLKKNNHKLISDRGEKINQCLSLIDKIIDKNKSLLEEISPLQASISKKDKLESKLKKLDQLRLQMEAKHKKYDLIIDFYSTNSNCPTCKQSIDNLFKNSVIEKKKLQRMSLGAHINELNEHYNVLYGEIEEATKIMARISELNSKITLNNQEIQLNELNITQYRKDIKELEKTTRSIEKENVDSESFKKQLEEFTRKKERLVNEREILSLATVLLKDGGIKTAIIKQYMPIINQMVNKYLSIMDFFVNFEIDENFSEVIKSRHRDEFSYDNFSEGEKTRIDLSLLFTWRAVSKLRNSASCNLIIFDEILDSSLDSNGTEEFLRIIDSLTLDNNVFIVSHRSDQMIDKFDCVIQFDKVKNFSKMVE